MSDVQADVEEAKGLMAENEEKTAEKDETVKDHERKAEEPPKEKMEKRPISGRKVKVAVGVVVAVVLVVAIIVVVVVLVVLKPWERKAPATIAPTTSNVTTAIPSNSTSLRRLLQMLE